MGKNLSNYLITGGAGFIGSNFIRFLLANDSDAQVYNLDALTYAGSLENLIDLPDPDRHHFIEGDICDSTLVNKIFSEETIDYVVHFAAESHVDRSIFGPEAFIQTNIHGTFCLLEAAKKAWKGQNGGYDSGLRFHHISTDEVYGTLGPEDPAFEEVTPYSPNSPYAASKAASDHLVRSYYHTYQLPVSITNCSNNYGPYQFPEKLIPVIIQNALEGNPLPIYGDGKQIRDWLYVEDHCRAISEVIHHAPAGETYNVGGGNQPTNLEIVNQICAILDELVPESAHSPHHSLITHVTDRPGHDRRYAMNINKIANQLNWNPGVSLETGLEKTVNWYFENQDWSEKIKKQAEYRSWMDQNYQGRKQS